MKTKIYKTGKNKARRITNFASGEEMFQFARLTGQMPTFDKNGNDISKKQKDDKSVVDKDESKSQ